MFLCVSVHLRNGQLEKCGEGGGLYIFFPTPSGLQEFFNSNNINNINSNNFICISFYKIYSLYKVEGMALYFEICFINLNLKMHVAKVLVI